MSATVTRPQCRRPGRRRWPGFLRKKVTLSVALTAAPMTAPLVPLMPLGRSTATIGAPAAFIASIMARATPSTGRSKPAPNSASTTSPAGAMRSGEAGSMARFQRCAAIAASPLSLAASPTSMHAHRVATIRQQPRRDEAVAAIVAGTGHDHDPRAERATRDRIGDGQPGLLHQVDAGVPPAIGEAVGFCHFGVGQQFNHRSSGPRARLRALAHEIGASHNVWAGLHSARNTSPGAQHKILEARRFFTADAIGMEPASRKRGSSGAIRKLGDETR